MACTATVTGKVGPAVTMTAAVITGITALNFNTETNLLRLERGSLPPVDVDITAAGTTTLTKVAGAATYTLTVQNP